MSYISSLTLHNFRSYESSDLKQLSAKFIVFYGANGAGKTNILEAVSLFSPGRGLRSAKPIEMQNNATQSPWALSCHIEGEYGAIQIGTGLDGATKNKRIVRVQGENARSQGVLSEYLACIWLTPQMDRLFLDSSSHRRRFLDRLIFAFDPGHSGRVTRYENAMRQRSKILQDSHKTGRQADASWLDGLERQMAETAIAIAAARRDFTARLQGVCDTHKSEYFPRAILQAQGSIEALFDNAPALEVEDLYRYQLQESRSVDMISGGAATGPHKSDLGVIMADKSMPAEHCSTGEQKALLIGILLAHARLIKDERGFAPILLLDEVAAHLDEGRRCALYDLLEGLGSQVWLSGTDRALFTALEGRGQFFEVENSSIHSR